MKKIVLTLATAAAALLLAPVGLSAQRIFNATHFEGERITGVEASSIFDVVLVRSNQTRSVVEVNEELTSYVRILRNSAGVVSINLREAPKSLWRKLDRLSGKERVIRLTLYLPSINTIRLSGASDITSEDSFPGEDVDIQLSGASDIKGSLEIRSSRVKLQASGASDATLVLPATRDLVVVASGASDIDITADGVTYSKLSVSGASKVDIKGDGGSGNWNVSGASRIAADKFVVEELSVTASGSSSARVNVSGTLTTKASGVSSIRYAGTPARINNLSDDVKPL